MWFDLITEKDWFILLPYQVNFLSRFKSHIYIAFKSTHCKYENIIFIHSLLNKQDQIIYVGHCCMSIYEDWLKPQCGRSNNNFNNYAIVELYMLTELL